ncbi:MAG TPA: hypothetical protein VHJ79_07815, partial [Mycobacterium sp.]|nr:hypothetical protein [Mycobacterium sp.]
MPHIGVTFYGHNVKLVGQRATGREGPTLTSQALDSTTREGALPTLQLVKDQADQQIPEIAKWDPELTKRVIGLLRPIAKRYFRSEIKDLGRIPVGGALLVSNHS